MVKRMQEGVHPEVWRRVKEGGGRMRGGIRGCCLPTCNLSCNLSCNWSCNMDALLFTLRGKAQLVMIDSATWRGHAEWRGGDEEEM